MISISQFEEKYTQDVIDLVLHFQKVNEEELPIRFSHPYQDCDFFLLAL